MCPKCQKFSDPRSTKGYCADHMAEAKAAYSERIADSKETARLRDEAYESIHALAHFAGQQAAEAARPIPMIVSGWEHQPVMDGVCGFAWVKVAGNCGFGRWAKKKGIMDKSYSGGVQLWVSGYGQSLTRKEAYAQAYAQTLRDSGIESAYPGSRMD